MRTVRPEQHGTATGYAYGCRCGRCREANALRAARYRTRTSRPSAAPESLPVACWRQAQIVHVPQAVVLACRTGTCGRPGCTPDVMAA